MRNSWGWWGVMVVGWGVMVATGMYRLDPDFGQHIKTGELIVKGGVPLTDPFSYTMASWEYIDHAWLTDVVMYEGWRVMGMGGLAVVFGTMAVAAVIVVVEKRWRKWAIGPVMAGLAVLTARFGVRPQVIDWLLMAVVWRIVEKESAWTKWRWVVPIIIGGWVNVHGGWVLAMVMVGWFWAARVIEKHKLEMVDVGVMGLMVVASGINPYGWELWKEVWLTLSDAGLRQNIAEWQPFFSTVEFGWIVLVGMVGALGWKYRREVGWAKVGWCGLMVMASGMGLRHGALFALVAIPIAAQTLELVWNDVRLVEGAGERWRKFRWMVMGLAGMVWLWEVGWLGIWMATGSISFRYPEKATEWLKANQVEGRMLAEYGWGGYLLWKVPEKKTFVDGRMPSWRREEAPEGESTNAFEEYVAVGAGENWEEILKKYEVRVVMWGV